MLKITFAPELQKELDIMLYQWLYSLSNEFSALNIFRYITVRTFIAFFTAFFLSLIWGPIFIRRLIERHYGQSIRDDGPQTHKKNQEPQLWVVV